MRRIKIVLLLLILVVFFVQVVQAVVLQSVPPGLDIFSFVSGNSAPNALTDRMTSSPEVHFFMSQKADGLISSVKYYVKGFLLLQNSPWYFLNTIWFVLAAVALALGLVIFSVSAVNLIEVHPVISHSVKENNLMASLLVVPLVGLAGVKYLLLAMIVLAFSFARGGRKGFGPFLLILLLLSVLGLSFVINSVSYCSTKQFRQIVDVNTGYQLTPAESLSNSQEFNERFSYILSLQLSGNFEEAVNGYRDLLDKRTDGRVLVNLGNCYFMLGQTEEARSAYEDAIKTGVKFTAYYNLSVLEREGLNFQKADEYFKKASELDIDRITSLKATGLYGPLVLNEYLSSLEIARMGISNGLKGIISKNNLIFLVSVLLGILVVSFLNRQSEEIKVCPKCGRVFCSKCEKVSRDRQICTLCFQTLVAIGLPLEKRVAHLVASQHYRASRRRFLLIESFVFPWMVFTSQKAGSLSGFILGGLFYFFLAGAVMARVFSFNTLQFLGPVGTVFLFFAVVLYLAGAYMGYRTYRTGGI